LSTANVSYGQNHFVVDCFRRFSFNWFWINAPILSIFIKDNLGDGSVFAAGIAVMLFMVTKSLVQLPLSKIVDKRKRDFRIKLVITGTLVVAVVPIIYIFSTQVIYIDLAQMIYDIGSGLSFPSWMALWSKNSAINRKSYDWSIYFSLTGIGTALAAVVGATIAGTFGVCLHIHTCWSASPIRMFFVAWTRTKTPS